MKRVEQYYIHLVEPRVAGNSEAVQFDAALNSRNFKPLITGDTKLISNGGHTLASGTEAVQSGEADAIAWGGQFIANPDLVERFLKNAPHNRYERETFYGGSEKKATRIIHFSRRRCSREKGFIAVPGSSDVRVRIPQIFPAIPWMV